jgi:hypothetical protein
MVQVHDSGSCPSKRAALTTPAPSASPGARVSGARVRRPLAVAPPKTGLAAFRAKTVRS